MDGLSFTAWAARGDWFVTILVSAAFVWTLLSVGAIGLFRLGTGATFAMDPVKEHSFEVQAGVISRSIGISGLVVGIISHFGLALALVFAARRGGFELREGILSLLVLSAYTGMLLWVPTLRSSRYLVTSSEIRERLGFWMLFLSEIVLVSMFFLGS